MKAPADYPRRILLAVTGLSPQIVTETLYALAHSDPPFLPNEVHLITTADGARLARAALLHADGGQFHALLADYPALGKPAFPEANIHVITGPDGKPLADIRTPAENAAAADAITALMAELTRDAAAALHVSIAGGRKTMGFYLGYAFSLYARAQDRLSHVLVSPPFEGHPDFFFPPARPKRLTTRDNRYIDTAEATVTLAEIPVVLLRHGLPEGLSKGRSGYVETVAALNESFAPPRLIIDLTQRRVQCGRHPIALQPALLAWLAFWAQTALAGRPLRHWREIAAEEYLRPYGRVVGSDSEAYQKADNRLADGMEREFFEQNNAKLEGALKKALGPAATPYLLARAGKKPYTRRGLALPTSAIDLRE